MLVAVPDSLAHGEIVPNLNTRWLAHSYHSRTIGSTNDYALLLAAEGAPHGALVVAEQQTKGRGRLKREWMSSPNRGIYLSILLRNPLPVGLPPVLLIGALALVKMLREDSAPRLHQVAKRCTDKWAKGRGNFDRNAVGPGFFTIQRGGNRNQCQPQQGGVAGPFRYPATSIAIETGFAVKRQKVLLEFLAPL